MIEDTGLYAHSASWKSKGYDKRSGWYSYRSVRSISRTQNYTLRRTEILSIEITHSTVRLANLVILYSASSNIAAEYNKAASSSLAS